MRNNKSTAAFGNSSAEQAYKAVLASIENPKERRLLRRKLVCVYWEDWDDEDRELLDPHIFDNLIFQYWRICLHTMEHIGRILAFVPRNLHPNFNYSVVVTGLGNNEKKRLGYTFLDFSD